uniref:Uncharacterized protein U23 n=1 Tax=Hyposoter didymator TaxID=260305 RepID=D7P5Q4_HYPDD|nr:unknown [Hyposoter didymator]
MVGYQQTPWCSNTTMQNGEAVLSDARLIKIIHTFFELDDLKMSCNDMLTKVLSVFRDAIATGGLQEILNGFMLFLCGRREKHHGSPIPRIATYWDFKILIAGLLKRFSNDKSLKDVLDTYDDTGVVDRMVTGGYSLRLNSNIISMMDTAPYAGIRLLPPTKLLVLEPKQAAVLVYLFRTYYSNNTGIDDSAVRNFMGMLEKIDESIHGSVSARESDFRPVKSASRKTILATHQDASLVVRKYIMGQYSYIFSMLNQCFLRYDFLNNTEATHPRYQTKELVLNYLSSLMGLPANACEEHVWTTYVNDVGAVTSLTSMLDSGATNMEFLTYIVLQSLMLVQSASNEGQSYHEQYMKLRGTVAEQLRMGRYSKENPYDPGVIRKDDASLNIGPEKLKCLQALNKTIESQGPRGVSFPK